MFPEAALQKQIERYRQMSGEERLGIALRLHEMSCEIAREGIRAQYPRATADEVEKKLHDRLRLAHGLSACHPKLTLASRDLFQE
jgi:Rv0078B-related antitoxin